MLALVAGFATLTLSLSTRAATVSASSARTGRLQITKNCEQYNGNPGEFCTITSSNLLEIPSSSNSPGPAGIPCPDCAMNPQSPGMLDSSVVLYVGTGGWAVGRCTLDNATNLGVCTFSHGTGHLTGFSARVDVRPFSSSPTEVNYYWDATYSFRPEPPQ